MRKQSPLYQLNASELDRSNETTFRYLILSSPRTGSSMVCSSLRASEMAGVPLEYFHPECLSDWFSKQSTNSLENYMAELEKRRTTTNGYFGIKIHYNQWVNVFGKNLPLSIATLKKQDRIILITRKNKTKQAISCLIAQKTNIWQIEEDEDIEYKKIDWQEKYTVEIALLIYQMIMQETSWKLLLVNNDISYLEIVYEDLIADQVNQYQKIYDYLSIPLSGKDIALPSTKRNNTGSGDFLGNYLKGIGCV